ncbi:hypothetical protein BDV95DRAFT_629805 [Massariosphaeria phaeospora]|uniref:RNA helicase n=1 Tax=Massariosphaeria phaeospora TaxID=100035 RepID=A0A7C8M6D9_9PLEO|nr:hypothetical protein BDV95DRAFT_629805 [Massariosphaeria phaeospora]
MASRQADESRSRTDERGGVYRPPRREDRRYHPDDRRDTRRDDRREDRREFRREDRYDGRREPRRERDHRRSRSPARRDRDRNGGDRYREDRSRGTRERDRAHDDRDPRKREDRRGSYDDRRRGSSQTQGGRPEQPTKEEREQQDREQKLKEEAAVAEAKKARLEKWKQQQALKKKQSDTATAVLSPAATTSPTPVAATPPNAAENQEHMTGNAPIPQTNGATIKKGKKKAEQTKLDEPTVARPLFSKATSTSVTAPSGVYAPTPANGIYFCLRKGGHLAAQQLKANGSITSFGLKAKAPKEVVETTHALLDDQDNTRTRKLQVLPDFVPADAPSSPVAEDTAMDEIGSDDEETDAQTQAQLEKRREDMANQELDATGNITVANENGDHMDIDGTAGPDEEEVDPLDAFMAGLSETRPNDRAPQGQTIFSDEIEPDMTAVDDEDFFALAMSTKKKKKEIPKIDHSSVEYEYFRKDFYTEPAEIAQMTPEEVADLRLELDGIKVTNNGNNKGVPRPVTKWAQMGLLQPTMAVFNELRYEKPTAIQAQAVPIVESGMDMIGIAKTGSGKTLAFGIPMVRHILDQRALKSSDGPIVLILAPTRELSLQIVNELKPFLKASNLKIGCAYGGPPISEHIAMIKRGGLHVLCATPGRLIDLMQSNSGRVLSFRRITYVVLDEADRMFDMGFEPQVLKVLDNIRPDRQAILFSATMPKNMAAVVRKHFHHPVEVLIGGRSVVASDVTQIIDIVPPPDDKPGDKKVAQLLLRLGQTHGENENSQVLIFTEKQSTAEKLLKQLIDASYAGVDTIHGGKDQSDRSDAINSFKRGILPILIATSVAARGLDVPHLATVINYDCPTHLEDYVHRCGRTGRAGNKGTAITFIENPGQERFAHHLIKALKQSDHEVPKELEVMAASFNSKLKDGTEKYFGGFGGKGLSRLDEARAAERRKEKRSVKIEGVEDQSDDEPVLPAVKKLEVVSGSGTAGVSSSAPATAVAEPEYMKILNSKIVVSKTERAAAGSTKTMTPVEKAQLAARSINGRLSTKGQIHAGQPIDNKGPDAGLYHATVEINDFPQKARWAVTNRTNVAKILEQTGVSITTKGSYWGQEGKLPGENDDPKLYILVEGDTEGAVTLAMKELTRHLREGSVADQESSMRAPTGRYSVI